jgi:predicted phosphate transport protein (TIGR00153 family)
MKFLKRDQDFFEMFDSVGKNLMKASNLLVQLFEDFDHMEDFVKAISDLEHENDLLTHEIFKKLNQTFLTPIDREDIHALASKMDDVLDFMWGAAHRSQIFKIPKPTEEAVALAKTLVLAIELVCKTLSFLRSKKYSYILDQCIEIHSLENQNDRIFREALGKMFDEVKDPITIIKWKEVYENLETAADRCEDVANTLEAIVMKNA